MKTSLFFLKTISLLFLLSIFILSGCSDTETPEPTPKGDVTLPEMDQVTSTLDGLAGGVSLLINESEVREFLKKEALKQFDGDYNVLYQHIKNHEFSDGKSFENKFAEHYAVFNNLSVEEALSQVQQISSTLPLLNIGIPVNIEAWDPETEIIPVTFGPNPAQNENYSHVKVYLKNGKTELISVRKDPDFPVIVVGLNERCNDDGTVNERFLHTSSSSSSSPVESFSEGQDIELWQVNVPDLSEWESWLYGKPEFIMTVAGGEAVGSSNGISYLLKQWMLPGSRSDYNDPASWFVMNEPIWPNWDNDIPGRLISVNVGEEDGGIPIEVEIKLFEIKVKKPAWLNFLTFNLGTVKFGNIGENHKDLGTIAIDRNSFPCWTDFYLGPISDKHFRFYLNCP
ncbi:MAG: hypothetical protein KDE26_11980 [Bacteroidetes bacterium]|nr:hypothetical protein [Bacteroidota bacterium]MCB0843964.1 hypothetical protein [Bacteroidota bacterium]